MKRKETVGACTAVICLAGVLTIGGAWARSGDDADGDSGIRRHLRRNSETSLRAGMLHADAYVEGFPLIVGVQLIVPKSYWMSPRTIYLRDLASTFEQSSGFELLMLREGEESPLFLHGRRLSEPFDAPDYRTLSSDEGVVMWIDVAQLVVPTNHVVDANEYPQTGLFPREGLTKLAWTTIEWTSASSPIVEFDVRKATAEEARIGGVLKADGVGRSWFPATFFLDEGVPESSHLPPESRRIVAFIDVMRKALRDSNQGLIAIQSYDFDLWGYMAELISMVEYECLRDTGRNSEATSLRSSSSSVVFDMVDRGDGLVRRLRRVRDGEVDYLGEMSKRALEEALEQQQK